MKFENTEVFNFEGAIRGMRNPLESWHKSDSKWEYIGVPDVSNAYAYIIGPNDLDLAQRLIAGGQPHRKFLRQIMVSVDITAPLYWWKEFDTYKVGTTANSTSTMHKLASTPITLDCFEIGDYEPSLVFDEGIDDHGDKPSKYACEVKDFIETEGIDYYYEPNLIEFLETLRQKYVETKDKRYWKELIRWLPEGWLQTRTVTMNYENIYNMCEYRAGHKLVEWRDFIDWAHELPYSEEFIFYKGE